MEKKKLLRCVLLLVVFCAGLAAIFVSCFSRENNKTAVDEAAAGGSHLENRDRDLKDRVTNLPKKRPVNWQGRLKGFSEVVASVSAEDDFSHRIEVAKALAYDAKTKNQARLLLEGAAVDVSLSLDDRAEATYHLVELLSSEGEEIAAIEAIEDLADTVDDLRTDFNYKDKLGAKLQDLLLGEDFEPDWKPIPDEPSGALLELANVLPCAGDLDMLSFAGRAVQDAFWGPLQKIQSQVCAKKKKQLEARGELPESWGLSSSHSGTRWQGIPIMQNRMEQFMVFYGYDAAAHPIPRRYEDLLPVEYSLIEQTLASGKGLVAIEIGEELPKILAAAPDQPLLIQTLRAFQELDKLPQNGVFITALSD